MLVRLLELHLFESSIEGEVDAPSAQGAVEVTVLSLP